MKEKYTFEELVEIVEKLRSENGCPWDIEQTHQSIKHSIIEEGYELIEELDNCNWEKAADESGDLLLQVVFHARIGQENGEYNIDDVINAVCKKLIHRHPHVFGDVSVQNSEEVLRNWNRIKREERSQKTVAQDMAEVSKYLPALMRAEKIQGKAQRDGYVFSEPVLVAENISQLISIMLSNTDTEVAEKYIGKMLFDIVSLSEKMGVNAETALTKHIESFIQEYSKHEG